MLKSLLRPNVLWPVFYGGVLLSLAAALFFRRHAVVGARLLAAVASTLEHGHRSTAAASSEALAEIDRNANRYPSAENEHYQTRAHTIAALADDAVRRIERWERALAHRRLPDADSVRLQVKAFADTLYVLMDGVLPIDDPRAGAIIIGPQSLPGGRTLEHASPGEWQAMLPALKQNVSYNEARGLHYCGQKIDGDGTGCYFGRPPVVVARNFRPRAGEVFEADVFLTDYAARDDYTLELTALDQRLILDKTSSESAIRVRCTEPGIKSIRTDLVAINRWTKKRDTVSRTFEFQVLPRVSKSSTE